MAHLINRSIAAQSAQSCNLLRQVTPRFIARNLRNVLKAIALFQQWQHVWRTGEEEEEGKRGRGWRRGMGGGKVPHWTPGPQCWPTHEAMRLRRFLSTCLLCSPFKYIATMWLVEGWTVRGRGKREGACGKGCLQQRGGMLMGAGWGSY